MSKREAPRAPRGYRRLTEGPVLGGDVRFDPAAGEWIPMVRGCYPTLWPGHYYARPVARPRAKGRK